MEKFQKKVWKSAETFGVETRGVFKPKKIGSARYIRHELKIKKEFFIGTSVRDTKEKTFGHLGPYIPPPLS